jgi:SAM-dependent methyltransferase
MKNNLDQHVRAYEGSNIYDFDNEILLNWYANRIIELTNGKGTLLELGLGHGYTTNIFSDYFSRHIVLEGSISVINNFKVRFPACKAEIIETWFEEFDCEEKFDVVVLGFILEHVDNPVGIMNYYKKYVKEGGAIFVSVPNAEVLNRRLGYLAGILPDITALSENDILLGHQRYYTVKTLTDDIFNAGYEVEYMEGIYLKPVSTTQMISLNLDKRIIKALCQLGIDYPELCCGILAKLK